MNSFARLLKVASLSKTVVYILTGAISLKLFSVAFSFRRTEKPFCGYFKKTWQRVEFDIFGFWNRLMMHSQLPLQNAGKLSRFSITEDCADIQQGIYREELVHFYRPQRSCGKIIFSQASVSHSVHRGGVCLGACWDLHTPSRYPPGRYTPSGRYTPPPRQYTPWAGTSPRQVPPQLSRYTPPPWQSLQWTVRILLDCFLVNMALVHVLFRNKIIENSPVKG